MADTHGLSTRTPLIGRKEEIQQLNSYLRAPGSERHFVYYWAEGGLGKTRLLEELAHIVAEAGPGFYFSGIIDLYHTDTHSTSDLERTIVEGLDPDKKYFAEYRQARRRYEGLRERGTDPGVLEGLRQELGNLFVKGCREMASDARKLVIGFDTVELLQYESSIIEEKAGLDTADTRIKPWLLEKLSQLTNVLVVFAGRPRRPIPGETSSLQEKFIADMKQAFGEDFIAEKLAPFTREETQYFLKTLAKAKKGEKEKEKKEEEREILPSAYLPIVHRLTGGRPIFLHLLADRLMVLAPESRTILELFDEYADLTDAPDDDPRLKTARKQVERKILDAVFNHSGEIGGYLTRMALMPKGVDAEILQVALGLPIAEAEQWLQTLESLSFIKKYIAPPGSVRLHSEHLFLHDEVYRLLTLLGIIPYLRMNERAVANTLVQNYYNPRVDVLEKELDKQEDAEQRLTSREEWQKLLTERLYYMLVADPRQGYREYQRLSDQANRRRWVGFGMRTLDEFLRFYNTPERQKLFEIVGISSQQVIRESAWMWVERFDRWGQDDRVIQLAEFILKQPEEFYIHCSEEAEQCSPEDLALSGNIYAYWVGARARRHGYESHVVETAEKMLEHLPPSTKCTVELALTRALLTTAIGYQYRLGGMLNRAASYYVDAKAAFRSMGAHLSDYEDEYVLLLNNLAFVYAKQGRMALARPLAHEALRRNEARGSDYHTGMTLSTLSQIARLRGNYPQAKAYGEEALVLFRELGDVRGTVLAHQGIAQAQRRMAKHEFEKGRSKEQENLLKMYEQARDSLNIALKEATDANIGSVIPELKAELGRVYRELGAITSQTEGFEKGIAFYHQAQEQLSLALKTEEWDKTSRVDTLQDLAEVYLAVKNHEGVQTSLEQIENLVGHEYLIVPGEKTPTPGLAREYFETLGKVEMLRGQIAYEKGALEEYIKYFVLAYAYFMLFSPDTIQRDTMIEYLYVHLENESVEKLQEILETIQAWGEQHSFGVDVKPFVQTLVALLGV